MGNTRVAILAIFGLILLPAIYFALQLEPQTTTEEFLPSDHPFQRYFGAMSEFGASAEEAGVQMQMVWGFEESPLDTTGVNMLSNPDFVGTLRYAPTFVFDEAAQLAIIQDCAILRESEHTKNNVDTGTG